MRENPRPDRVVNLAGSDGVHAFRDKRADHEPVGRVELVDDGAAVNGAERGLLGLGGNRDDLPFLLQPGSQAVAQPVEGLKQGGRVGRYPAGVPQHGLQHVGRQAELRNCPFPPEYA